MHPFKRFVSLVCVFLGGDDPKAQKLPKGHAWLLPGPSFLNSLIAWANARPALVPVPVAVEARRS